MDIDKGYRREQYTDPRTPGVAVELVVHHSTSGDFGGFWIEQDGQGPIFVALPTAQIERLREQLTPVPQQTWFPLV